MQSDSRENCDFQDNFDCFFEEPEHWTWQDPSCTKSCIEGPPYFDLDLKYSVDYNSPMGLPIPAFSSPAGGGLSYRLRRHIKRQSAKSELKVERHVERHHVSCSDTQPQVSPNTALQAITAFIRTFNPATTGMSLLRIERFHGRHAPKPGSKRVSVDIKSCLRKMCKHIASNVCTFPAYEEFVHNAFQDSNLPLIVDTGASCCVSPRRDDFISGTYRPSNVKIKDLSGANKVAGRGMIRWTVRDASGKAFDIEIEGYHVPQASVRLLSPQCLYSKFGPKSLGKSLQGYGYQDDSEYIINLPQFDLVLQAKYGLSNLPVLPMNPSASPTARWNDVFLVSESDRNCWNQSQLDAKNQNLTLAQQELLNWHHKLSHIGISKIHYLCRQRKQVLKSPKDICELRDGPFLPCTYNVPYSVCDNLLCTACCISKASRRKPNIHAAGKIEKEMSLKEGHLSPGDCISCDHYISPVPGRVIATSGHSSSAHGYTAGTIYVDHSSGWIFHRPQKSTTADETIRGKLLLEREASDVNVKIKAYHSDNGIFSSKDFRAHCNSLNQELSFSGVGAKFQNGVAERSIQTICNMARANMIHASLCWPGMKFISFWALAMS